MGNLSLVIVSIAFLKLTLYESHTFLTYDAITDYREFIIFGTLPLFIALTYS